MAIPRIKKISMAAKRHRRRVITHRKYLNHMSGGPACALYLSTPGTMLFKLGEFHGFYNVKNEWVQI